MASKKLYWVSTPTMLLCVSHKRQALSYEGAQLHINCSGKPAAKAIAKVVNGKLVAYPVKLFLASSRHMDHVEPS
jgi:hypothetical protein